jgi:hypothetical protein
MPTSSESFVSIDGAETLGIRASSADSKVEHSLHFKPTRVFISASIAVACAVVSAETVGEMPSRNPLSTADVTNVHSGEVAPFIPAKLCLIPPFSP